MKYFALIFVVCNSCLCCFSQSKHINPADSFLKGLLLQDESKSDFFNELSKRFRNNGFRDSSIVYAKKALLLSEKINYNNGLIEAHLNLGNTYRELNQQNLALAHLENVLKFSERSGNINKIGDGYDNIGHIYNEMNNDSMALRYHVKALKVRRNSNDDLGVGNSNENIALIYSDNAEYQTALKYFSAALKHFKIAGDTFKITLTTANIGYCSFFTGNAYKALLNFEKALTQYKKLGNQEGIEWMEDMIAYVYSDLGYYDRALKYYFKRLKKLDENDHDKEVRTSLLGKIGRVYMQKNDNEKAIIYLTKSIAEAQKIKSTWEYSSRSYIASIKKKAGNLEEALSLSLLSHEQAVQFSDLYWQSTIKNTIGSIYFKLGNLSEAKKWLKEGIAQSHRTYYLNDLSNSYLLLSKIDNIERNYKAAYENYQLYVKYKKELQTDEAKKLIMQIRFNKKEEQRLEEKRLFQKQLENKKIQTNAAIGGVVLLTLLIISISYAFYVRNKKIKIEKYSIELKEKEIEVVKETERFKTRFIANISHEFRTPLTLINGNTDLLKKNVTNKDNIQQLEKIEQNSQDLLKLVNKLLDLSKMESGHYELIYKNGIILNEAQAYIVSFDSVAKSKNIHFTYSVSEEAENFLYYNNVHYSSEALQIIVNNILSNALKFTPEGGQVRVYIHYENQQFFLKVKDSGPGIPEKYHPKIFDRFYQVEETYNSLQKGSGIGLSLVKELALLHKGGVYVENNSDGGCLFTVWISCPPAGSTAQIPSEMVSHPQEISNTTEDFPEHLYHEGDVLILVVEDQHELRKFITENITGNYQFIEAPDGKKGLELAIQKVPDLIISDVMMPEINGIELCRKIKENEITAHIPFILLTARAEQADKIEGLHAGADDFLVKPFSIEELQLKVRNFIHFQQTLVQKFKSISSSEEDKIQVFPSHQQAFLDKLISCTRQNMSNPQFGVSMLSEICNLSSSQLTRKLKSITGDTPADFIRTIRLKKAFELLKNSDRIADVAWSVGFEDPAYFGKVFKKHFGFPPSGIERISI